MPSQGNCLREQRHFNILGHVGLKVFSALSISTLEVAWTYNKLAELDCTCRTCHIPRTGFVFGGYYDQKVNAGDDIQQVVTTCTKAMVMSSPLLYTTLERWMNWADNQTWGIFSVARSEKVTCSTASVVKFTRLRQHAWTLLAPQFLWCQSRLIPGCVQWMQTQKSFEVRCTKSRTNLIRGKALIRSKMENAIDVWQARWCRW